MTATKIRKFNLFPILKKHFIKYDTKSRPHCFQTNNFYVFDGNVVNSIAYIFFPVYI